MNMTMTDHEYEHEHTLRPSLRAPAIQPGVLGHRATPVVGFLVPAGHETLWVDDDPGQDEWERQDCASLVSNISRLAPAAARAQSLSPHYGLGRTKTGGNYLMNSCAHCRAAQGDFFLYGEPGGAFFPRHPKGSTAFE